MRTEVDLTKLTPRQREVLNRPGTKAYLGSAHGSSVMTETPQVLLVHHLKRLKLPTFLREYDKVISMLASCRSPRMIGWLAFAWIIGLQI